MKLRTRHRKLARWSGYFPDVTPSSNPRLIRARLLHLADKLGVRLIERRGFTPHGRRWSITVGRAIYLVAGFSDLPLWKQCQILGHELTHVLLVRFLGFARFYARWLFSRRYRWAIGAMANRWDVRMVVWQKRKQSTIDAFILRRTDNLIKGYGLRGISGVRNETVRILRKELP